MCLLFETIRIENGILLNAEWHEKRIRLSRREVWGSEGSVRLSEIVKIPDGYSSGVIRCNIIYGKATTAVSFTRYQKQPIHTFRLIDCGDLDYHLKYSDRSLIGNLFEKRGDCDEIILVKNNLITDTSISNIILSDGRRWYTPHKPLLNGTCRQRLLSDGSVHEAEITINDLGKFRSLKMVNAMRLPPNEEWLPTIAIKS